MEPEQVHPAQGEFAYHLPVLTDNYAPVDRYLIPVIN